MKKRYRFIWILVISALCILTSNRASAFDKKEDYIKEYKDSVYNMAKMMRCIPNTGDVDLDYLYEMNFLNEGEINFSKAYVEYATNEEVKSLAKNYIERDSAALENIRSIIEKNKDNPEVNKDLEEKYLKIYNNILSSMMCRFQKVELTEDINVDFLKFISIHHDGIIKISEEFLKIGGNDEVKEIAVKIVSQMKGDCNKISKYIE